MFVCGLSIEGQKSLIFHQKGLHLCLEDEQLNRTIRMLSKQSHWLQDQRGPISLRHAV